MYRSLALTNTVKIPHMSEQQTISIRDAILKRVDERLEALQMTQRSAEMKAFGKPDVIRNWRRKVVLPRIDTLMQLAPALETTVEWLLSGDSTVYAPASDLTPLEQNIDSVRVTGRVAANSWMDVDEMDFSYEDIQHVPSASGYPAKVQFGLVVDGNCLNKIARHGDVLVCLNIIATNTEVHPEDLVIVERSRYGGQMIERTAKRLRQTADGFELWPESTDPSHQEPIRLNGKTNADEDVRIIGKVLWILRRP